ncbi:methyltransferase type 11 [Streptomyces sp. NPDC093225]|uniref:methyltransferase type 11 n=1 Tax=Streptomyces sp. NPDC093225 TaxID=3366034 RepID=UPI00381CCB4F
MTPTLVARDWAEIQERMLVPLYEAVYDRLDVASGTRLLGLDCGAGLALLLAAARGAAVFGVEADPDRLALARERGLAAGRAPTGGSYDVVTDFAVDGSGDLAAVLPLVRRGGAVVLAGWGPPERCATAAVLGGAWVPPARDALELRAYAAGLVPDGSGRVFCPFGYADVDSAVRGLLSAGLCDAGDPDTVEKELAEALHPYVHADGTVWLPNLFRYVVARVP